MNLLIYGAGKRADYIIRSIKKAKHNILGVIDIDKKKQGKKFLGYTISAPENIADFNFDLILVTSDIYYEEISNELVERWNVDKSIIKHGTYISYLELVKYYKQYPQMVQKDMLDVLDYISTKESISDFNTPFFDYERINDIEVFWDSDEKLYYVYHNGKKMYFSAYFKNEKQVERYYSGLVKEQNINSPHRYLDDVFCIEEGDVILDGGVAEGNFSLDVIEKAKHVVLVEASDEWIRPLELTFAPYKEKVTIINKFLSDHDDENNITIDSIYKEYSINRIKLDIEGGEVTALTKASMCMQDQDGLKLAVCSYHNIRDEQEITRTLNEYGYKTYTTPGYMTFLSTECEPKLFVRGIVKGSK